MTLIQTKDVNKPLPILLHGNFYWDDVFNLQVLVEHGTISAGDFELFIKTDPVDGAFNYVVCPLPDSAMRKPEGITWTSYPQSDKGRAFAGLCHFGDRIRSQAAASPHALPTVLS